VDSRGDGWEAFQRQKKRSDLFVCERVRGALALNYITDVIRVIDPVFDSNLLS